MQPRSAALMPSAGQITAGRVIPWYALSAEEAAARLETDAVRGLTRAEAAARLSRTGPNMLQTVRRTPWYTVAARQFTSPLIAILALAALISLAVREPIDAIAILVIIIVNGALGFTQEWRAERALLALRAMLSRQCTVVRDGIPLVVDTTDLVPGDLVSLALGDRVPADVRLVAARSLATDESSLTGESGSVAKRVEAVEESAPLSDRASAACMGTMVSNGRGQGLVVATGMRTEFGRIAQLTQSVGDERTPLQRKLAALGHQLGIAALVICVAIALTGILMGQSLLDMILTSISLAVAIVPEGLPAVVTITLALGIRTMAKRRALLRRLQAAEALGGATVICTDKTGTLTQNEMTVRRMWLPTGLVSVTGVGYAPAGQFETDEGPLTPQSRPDLIALLEAGLRGSNAHVGRDDRGWYQTGEPTEAALVVAANKAGIVADAESEVVGEIAFTSARKCMTIIRRSRAGGEAVAYVKGAPERILERCTRMLEAGSERPLSEHDRVAAEAAYQSLAAEGLRTLAVARRALEYPGAVEEDDVEQDLVLLGIVGIIDPPRAEVPHAIAVAGTAGIRVVMVTGDAAATAMAIARRVGLRADRAITGADLDAMDAATLRGALHTEVLFARVSPEHKLRIVQQLQHMGHRVAMTGDGVNDAPALKQAEIGIAMGLRGTDVARSSADIILTDDNFSSIVGAVEEGRRQYANIQKFVRYLLSSNTAEVLAIFINLLLGGPLILLPVQILWMNLVTDGATALALGVEPREGDVMQRPPHRPDAKILDWRAAAVVLALGAYMAAATIGLFQYYLSADEPQVRTLAQTVAFTGLIVMEKVNVFNFRSLHAPLPKVGLLTNPPLLAAWGGMLALQAAAVYVPFLQEALHTVPLAAREWLLIGALSLPLVLITEGVKWMRGRTAPGYAVGKS